MAFRRRSLVLTGAAISVVALGILTNLTTNFMPEDALPPWLIWAALIIVSLIFIIFSFWQDRISSLRRMFFSRRLILLHLFPLSENICSI